MAGPQAQPLNAEISVFRRVRAQTNQDRHDPIKGMGRFGDKQVIAPSQEIRVLQTSDNVVSDAWRFGHPVVRYVRGNTAPTPSGQRTKTLQQVYDNVADLRAPLRLSAERRDIYIEKNADGVNDDLHGEVRDSN